MVSEGVGWLVEGRKEVVIEGEGVVSGGEGVVSGGVVSRRDGKRWLVKGWGG